jgi:putative transposase
VNFVRRWSAKNEIGTGRFIEWLDITASRFYDWRERCGKANEHNGWVPRDFWGHRTTSGEASSFDLLLWYPER